MVILLGAGIVGALLAAAYVPGVTVLGYNLANLPTQLEPAKYERMIFGIILVLLTLRGLRPTSLLSVSLFLPLTLLFGGLLDYVYRRRFSRR